MFHPSLCVLLMLLRPLLRLLVAPLLAVGVAAWSNAQAQGAAASLRLSGYVRSAASGEVVRRAQLSAGSATVESSDDGFYSLRLAPGTVRLQVRAIGFAPLDTVLSLTASATLDLRLAARTTTLSAVTVRAARDLERTDLDPRAPEMSVVRLDMATVKLLPMILGEPDPIRSLTLLPGVSLSSDASTAFSVRGGAADQNLFLLDEATVYNPSHILGFLSTFNADAIDNLTLHKGAIPARYGGRLASVVDVRQREGNANEFVGSATIGLLASRASLEGPLPDSIGSYMIAARRSYADLFTRSLGDSNIRDVRAFFYDLNGSASFRLGRAGALMASGYLGRDRFGTGDEFAAGWGNQAASLRWTKAIGGRLFSKVTATTGAYDYGLDFVAGDTDSLRWTSRIRNSEVRVDETLFLSPSNTIEFGVSLGRQVIRPGDLIPAGRNPTFNARQIQPRRTLLPAAYVAQELEFGRLALKLGLRYGGYSRRGNATIYQYADSAPVRYNPALGRYEPGVVTDSVVYAGGTEVIGGGGFEPRVSGRVMLDSASSIKVSYARTQQFLLLVSNTNSVSPLDVWEAAGPYIKPQTADQYALGFSTTRRGVELSIEGYYRDARNVVDFIDGSDVLLNPRVETQMVSGVGRAAGLELLVRRPAGRINGWVSYTLGRSEQKFAIPAAAGGGSGGINDGRWYPGPFDKTHTLNVVAMGDLGRKWLGGATFMLSTGLPTTFPSARYSIDGLLVTEFGPRNAGRLPAYHRLDLNATRRFRHGELQLGVLNAYNRFNAQSLRFRQQAQNPNVTEAVQTSIFGIVPSVSYAFHF